MISKVIIEIKKQNEIPINYFSLFLSKYLAVIMDSIAHKLVHSYNF